MQLFQLVDSWCKLHSSPTYIVIEPTGRLQRDCSIGGQFSDLGLDVLRTGLGCRDELPVDFGLFLHGDGLGELGDFRVDSIFIPEGVPVEQVEGVIFPSQLSCHSRLLVKILLETGEGFIDLFGTAAKVGYGIR